MRALQITGTVAVILGLFVCIVVLPVVGRFLKKALRFLRERAGAIPGQIEATAGNVTAAQEQVDALLAVTANVKAGMQAAIALADRVIAFLNSPAFQVGLPAMLWTLFLVVALPRGLRRRKKKGPAVTPIPPPSFERQE